MRRRRSARPTRAAALAINRPGLVERGEVDKYTWVDIRSSYLPGELIVAQLKVEEAVRRRRLSVVDAHGEAFAPLAEAGRVELPRMPPDCTGNGHMFYLLMSSSAARDAFIAAMKARGFAAPFHYVPLHSAPAGRRFGRASNDMSVTDRISETLVRLPMYFDLGSDVETVIEAVLEHFGEAGA